MSPMMLCYLWIKALFSPHSMSFFHQYVYHAGVWCLHVDEQLHSHDTMQDGVQRHNDWMAFYQCDETVAGSAAPLISQDYGLGWRTHSGNLELLSLITRREFLFYCLFNSNTQLYINFLTNSSHFNITTWNGGDRRSEGSSLIPLQGTTAVLPKSTKNTCMK